MEQTVVVRKCDKCGATLTDRDATLNPSLYVDRYEEGHLRESHPYWSRIYLKVEPHPKYRNLAGDLVEGTPDLCMSCMGKLLFEAIKEPPIIALN